MGNKNYNGNRRDSDFANNNRRDFDPGRQNRRVVDYSVDRSAEEEEPRNTDSLPPREPRLRIGITHGDFNGVGYEVILKALDDQRILELCTPVVYGSAKIAAFYRKGIDDLANYPVNQIESAAQARHDVVNFVNVIGQEAHIAPGQSTAEAGNAAFAALEAAVADLRAGLLDAIVTAPINKANIQSGEFTFPGHTEYFEAVANTPVATEAEEVAADTDGSDTDGHIHSLMMLCTEGLRVALVTNHLPLAEVAANISTERILDKLRIFEHSLKQDFSVVKPRIAVLSLNPHCGDGGLLGSEEQDIIVPAINEARAAGMMVFGPYPADGFFGNGLQSRFDGVLAMYHDQGLIPFKTLAMDSGVNFTAGLPFVRTSPDHGTGYDIAGQNKADASSMRAALYMATDIVRSRATYARITARPLRKLFVERGKDNVVLDLTKD